MKRIKTAGGDIYMADEVDARIAELEKALRKIVETAAPTSHHANYCVVHRQLLGEARALMVRGSHD